ncbi:hypothetical protein [Polaribacter sp. SA4-10]|uniref:hypothetical protein n=1 Tax=Polaribacter sp. SA4-10 TaxID=754397 RepID=UPI0012FCCC34|nr:hypothetical protein [Polaribacter sp. SA4-10]
MQPQHEKITYTFNTTWLPNDPSEISFAEDDVLINTGNAILSNTTFCNTLIVNPGAAVTVNTSF